MAAALTKIVTPPKNIPTAVIGKVVEKDAVFNAVRVRITDPKFNSFLNAVSSAEFHVRVVWVGVGCMLCGV